MSNLNPVSVENLTISYRQVEALRNINLTIAPGRVTGIIGPNGAGKSTLIKGMLGLISAQFGWVSWGDKSLAQQRDRVAYVPQRSQIDWTYPATVWDVVMMGRVKKTGWFRPFSRISRVKAQSCLERVGMGNLCDRPIGQLSGGQQQRVFLARSLAQEADIFFFDEPFVGVDQKTEAIIFDIFRELADENKIVMVVNHDLGESINNFDDLVLLNKSLIAFGAREQVLREENLSFAYGGGVSFYGHKAA
ncbi:ABC-type transport system ATPase component [Cyanobacterium sp. HL-69]|uniref:metal ABC transporter ATP-binding protein n=1 Tax=Cyanobacterium sp. HL-69 TaxID=2054282 RepID=UPI000CA266EB|nr:ABC-type transport system ATPase component [Cyanobacterium sp. HL-69]